MISCECITVTETYLRVVYEAGYELLCADHLFGPDPALLLEHDDGLLSDIRNVTHDKLLT